MRKGMLHREALGAMRDGDGWIVGFRYAPDPEDAEKGRRVEIDSTGNKICLQKEDVSLVPFRILRIVRESSARGDRDVFSRRSPPEREKSD